MSLDWKTIVGAVVAALVGAGGTLGAQKITTPVASASQLQLVEGMTGLCIRVERTEPKK